MSHLATLVAVCAVLAVSVGWAQGSLPACSKTKDTMTKCPTLANRGKCTVWPKTRQKCPKSCFQCEDDSKVVEKVLLTAPATPSNTILEGLSEVLTLTCGLQASKVKPGSSLRIQFTYNTVTVAQATMTTDGKNFKIERKPYIINKYGGTAEMTASPSGVTLSYNDPNLMLRGRYVCKIDATNGPKTSRRMRYMPVGSYPLDVYSKEGGISDIYHMVRSVEKSVVRDRDTIKGLQTDISGLQAEVENMKNAMTSSVNELKEKNLEAMSTAENMNSDRAEAILQLKGKIEKIGQAMDDNKNAEKISAMSNDFTSSMHGIDSKIAEISQKFGELERKDGNLTSLLDSFGFKNAELRSSIVELERKTTSMESELVSSIKSEIVSSLKNDMMTSVKAMVNSMKSDLMTSMKTSMKSEVMTSMKKVDDKISTLKSAETEIAQKLKNIYPQNCYIDKPTEYKGTVSVTEQGVECQRWSSHTPHQHTHLGNEAFHGERYPSNYCRSPNKSGWEGDRPWCFTTDPNIRWQYCDVHKC